jgi:putative transposase
MEKIQLKPNQIYHLYSRANSNHDLLFFAQYQYASFLKRFRKYLEKYVNVYAYCLMPNHFHFMIELREVEDIEEDYHVFMTKKIKNLLISYSKWFNIKHDRRGALFQRSFKIKHVDNSSYSFTLIDYIHKNPVRANLVAHAKHWIFSSYHDYAEYRDGTLVDKSILEDLDPKDFIKKSDETNHVVDIQYWI